MLWAEGVLVIGFGISGVVRIVGMITSRLICHFI